MKKKVLSTLLVAALTASLFAGCTSSTTTKAPAGNNDGTTAEGGADEGGEGIPDGSGCAVRHDRRKLREDEVESLFIHQAWAHVSD